MSRQKAMRSFSKREGKCPKCGFKGAMDLVETKGKRSIWTLWLIKFGEGVKLLCPNCNHLF